CTPRNSRIQCSLYNCYPAKNAYFKDQAHIASVPSPVSEVGKRMSVVHVRFQSRCDENNGKRLTVNFEMGDFIGHARVAESNLECIIGRIFMQLRPKGPRAANGPLFYPARKSYHDLGMFCLSSPVSSTYPH